MRKQAARPACGGMMQLDGQLRSADDQCDDHALVVSGDVVSVTIERGDLLVRDGMTEKRRTLRIPRASLGLKRLIVHGDAGSVSRDALAWIRDSGVTFIHLDHDGDVIGTATRVRVHDIRVRRGLSLASRGPASTNIARWLLTAKIEGQREVLRDLQGRTSAVRALTEMLNTMERASAIADIRYIEARASACYWDAWHGVPISFAADDRGKVPNHWLAFDVRYSRLPGSARKAGSPTEALLNFLYGLLEAEARLASARVGCDQASGLIHADHPTQAGFARDLMEPLRPQVDAVVLQLLKERAFRKSDFLECGDGHCRLLPPLPATLAETAPRWAAALRPCAEQFAGAMLCLPIPGRPT